MAITLNGTTGIVTADGSVGAPGLKGTDADSGLSFAADSIKFSTGGVERMAISNSGVTGISAGKILEVVSAVSTTLLNSTTVDTDLDTNLSGSITTTGSNKVLVLVNQNIVGRRTTTGGLSLAWKLQRSTDGGGYSVIYNSDADPSLEFRASGVSVYNVCRWNACLNFLDSPGAGTHTYKTTLKMSGGEVTMKAQEDGHPSTITFMEVEA
tara:strand:+ start:3080 stop:3709 length:630 start_codon:yes stop_codon:yes gene_type:complete